MLILKKSAIGGDDFEKNLLQLNLRRIGIFYLIMGSVQQFFVNSLALTSLLILLVSILIFGWRRKTGLVVKIDFLYLVLGLLNINGIFLST